MAARKTSASTRKSAPSKKPALKESKHPKEKRVMSDEPYAFHEVLAIVLAGVSAMFVLALISYSPADLPSWVPFSSQSGQNEMVVNFIGPVGAVVAGYAYFFFGAACFLIPAVLAWWSIQVLTGARPFHARNLFSFAFLVCSAACLIEFQVWFFQDWSARYNLPKSAGGFFGYGVGHKLVEHFLGSVGSVIVVSIVYVIALIVITGIHPFQFLAMLRVGIARLIVNLRERGPLLKEIRLPFFRRAEPAMPTRSRARARAERASAPPKEETKPAKTTPASSAPLQADLFESAPEPRIIDSSQSARKKLTPEEAAGSLFDREKKEGTVLAGVQFPDYQLPSLSILQYADDADAAPTNESELIQQQTTIVSTLATFGVDVEPGDITRGPTITRYELYPTPGLRVNRITSLEADLARATKAERINILAPVPGKDTVGIEIANNEKIPVALRELFEDEAFRDSKAKLPLALGKDVYGRTIVGDLARMPHLLVAGATGSGKSVCINSIIASLLYRFTPDELRFIMVDPKVVEMQLYNNLPHMVIPVVTDPKKVLLALRWVINEMERRYALFAKAGTRNFDGFNAMRTRELAELEAAAAALLEEEAAADVQAEPELVHHVRLGDDLAVEGGFPGDEEAPDLPSTRQNRPAPASEALPESLPYIVVIIDELADLMQTAPADVETGIARIAQKARAAGIHLIVATQTPRADVVTGIIKANIPSRIAFQVSSKTDSRIILDANGAENLVGKGDMLYLPPGSAQLIRAQGALITDEEAQDLVDACGAQGQPCFEPDAQEAIESGEFGEGDDEISDADEEILEKCLEVIYSEKKASTSLLQRRLRLGYTRAARMIDILESRGIVGAGEGAKPREILVDLSDDFE
ncbi:MAG: DNA translocase FtsK [Verrucomicrobiaceae bacterium]|nr:DNA translocase FtsK [Verrucomicrobiaceae bacterium]